VKTRVYAIGDVHGRLDLLERLYLDIARHSESDAAERKVLVHLGDYIDRGPDSKGVIARIMAGMAGFQSINLMGNHEELLLDYIDRRGEDSQWWITSGMGGAETLLSFGVDPDEEPRDPAELERKIGPEMMRWLRGLKIFHREGGFMFVHAGLRPGVPIDQQTREDMLWIREAFTNSKANFGLRVVYGHSPSEDPVIKPHRIGIDTGAVWTGRLTAAVLDPEQPQDEPLMIMTDELKGQAAPASGLTRK